MRTYRIRSRFLEDGGWKVSDAEVYGSLYDAGQKASERAHVLDARFGADHFWTVDVYHLDNGQEDGLGSYYQLFHGRLR